MSEIEAPAKKNYKKYLIILWCLFWFGILATVGVFWGISKGYLGYLPPLEEIENPIDKFATQIISADNEPLASIYYSKENRTRAAYHDLSPYLVNALISTEDVRFSKHSGIDFRGLTRAIVGVLSGKEAGGGSTITQQLAKLLYTANSYGVPRWERGFQKLNEFVIAVKLERIYTKEEIIALYLNKFDFLNNAVGINKAANVYFNTIPAHLKVEEAALLVGMLKNPNAHNPRRFVEVATNRRNTVFAQMEKAGHLTRAERDSLRQLPITLNFQVVDHKVGPIPYLREYLRKVLGSPLPERKQYRKWGYSDEKFLLDSAAWADDPLYGWCNKNFKPDGSNYSLYTDGLKIYTTIDSRMQRYARESVVANLANNLQPKFFAEKKGRSYAPFARNIVSNPNDLEKRVRSLLLNAMHQTERYRKLNDKGLPMDTILKIFNTPVKTRVFSWNGDVDTVMSPMDSIRYMKFFLRAGFFSMDPITGHVKAYVGGPDFKYFQYDMVTTGKRQVGSTVKPFLYTLAMQEGYTPCSKFRNAPITIYDANGIPWTPRNEGDDRLNEMVTLKWGLAMSNNFISARLMEQFNPNELRNFMHSMGIRSKIDAVPAMCLGPSDISLEEMVRAYSVYANKGVMVEPLYVTRIEDKDGNVLSTFTTRKKEVIHQNTAYLMNNLLQGVVNTVGGTGSRLRWRYQFKGQIGGKTGTTQNQSDGWFVGLTPRLVSAGWVGGEDRSIHFDGISMGQGAEMVLPIWAEYMKSVYANDSLPYTEEDEFEAPEGFNINLDCEQFEEQSFENTKGKTEEEDSGFF